MKMNSDLFMILTNLYLIVVSYSSRETKKYFKVEAENIFWTCRPVSSLLYEESFYINISDIEGDGKRSDDDNSTPHSVVQLFNYDLNIRKYFQDPEDGEKIRWGRKRQYPIPSIDCVCPYRNNNGEEVIICGRSYCTELYFFKTMKKKNYPYRLLHHTADVLVPLISRIHKYLFIGDDHGNLKIVDINSGNSLLSEKLHGKCIMDMKITSAKNREVTLLSCGADKRARIVSVFGLEFHNDGEQNLLDLRERCEFLVTNKEEILFDDVEKYTFRIVLVNGMIESSKCLIVL